MVCSLHLRKDAVELKQVWRKPTKKIKQLPDKGRPKNAGLCNGEENAKKRNSWVLQINESSI